MKAFTHGLLIVVLGGFAGVAAALPDLARGIAAMERGDFLAAEADLRPLAEKGYVEAQIRLARLYAREKTPQARAEAIMWYRHALQRDETVRVSLARELLRSGAPEHLAEIDTLLQEAAAAGDPEAPLLQLRLYGEHPELTTREHAAQLAATIAVGRTRDHLSEAISWYRANSRIPEYDRRLFDLCIEAREWLVDCAPDLARHYRGQNDREQLDALHQQALQRFEAGTMPAETVERFARELASTSLPGEPAPKAAYELFQALQARDALMPAARARMAKLLIDHPEVDVRADAEGMLIDALAEGSQRAALYLGRLYLDAQQAAADPVEAERLLTQAGQTQASAHYYLGRLYERGYLGDVQADLALRHYLIAARSGYRRADLALARMFWNNRGVRVDAVNAYTFARLALHDDIAGARELIDELHRQLPQAAIERGQQLAEEEFVARQAFARASSPQPTTTQTAAAVDTATEEP